MLPAGLLAALGLDVATLVGTAEAVPSLIEIFDIAWSSGSPQGVFSRFRGLLAKATDMPRTYTDSQLYRAARFWNAQGSYINKYQGDFALDPRLAQVVVRSLDDFSPTKRYMYNFQIDSTDPITGKTTTLYRMVQSGVPLSIGEAADQLRELIQLHADIYEEITGTIGGEEPPPLSFTLRNFYRFEYRGRT